MKLYATMEDLPVKYQQFPIRDYADLTPEEKELALEIIFKFIKDDEAERAATMGEKPFRYRRSSSAVTAYLESTRWRWYQEDEYDDWEFEWTTGFYFDT